MKPVLKNPVLEKQLLDEGYVMISFLSPQEIVTLKDTYYQSQPKQLEGMAATAHFPDLDLRMRMNDTIRKVFHRAMEETFTHINALGGSFIAKGKGSNGTLNPHQDWNIVDEDHFRSFNIWVPLVDLEDDNGVICIMPRSHTWLRSYRSLNIGSAYHEVEGQLWKKMTRLYMKAGEALIYDHRLIHASGENKTNEIRLASVFGIIPEDANMFYYHKKDDKTIEVYESNKEFFLYENIFEGPKKLKKLDQVSYTFPLIDAKQLDRFESGYKPGVLDRLKALINF
jgi:hypothetical protein